MSDSPGAVQRHEVYTTDPDEAVAHQQAYARFRAGPIEREGFEFALRTASAGPLSVGRMRHGARIEARSEPTPAFVTVEVLDGEAGIQDGHRHDTTSDVLLAPHWSPYASHWAGSLRLTALDLDEVGRVGAELSGLEPSEVRFGRVAPRSPAHARYWARIVDHVERDLLAHDELMARLLLRQEARHQLIVAALVVFPNSTLDLSAPGRDTGEPATVRRAMAFIDAHADEDITVTDVADAARMGARGLQAAFRRHRDETPLTYLRRVRLERAHRELEDADPAGHVTIGEVAARWGFSNAGRFSALYRQTYGRSPRETLRR